MVWWCVDGKTGADCRSVREVAAIESIENDPKNGNG